MMAKDILKEFTIALKQFLKGLWVIWQPFCYIICTEFILNSIAKTDYFDYMFKFTLIFWLGLNVIISAFVIGQDFK